MTRSHNNIVKKLFSGFFGVTQLLVSIRVNQVPNRLSDCPPVLGLLPTCLLDIGEFRQLIKITLNCKVIVVNLEIMSSPSSTKAHQIPKVLSAPHHPLQLLANPALSSLEPWNATMTMIKSTTAVAAVL